MSKDTKCHENTLSLESNDTDSSTSKNSDSVNTISTANTLLGSVSNTMPANNNPGGNETALPNGHAVNEKREKKSNHVKPRKNLTLPVGDGIVCTEALPPPKSSWLLRLFESKLFEMSIAIAYLFKSKEPGVLTYLGNKLFVSTYYSLD
jgi:phosphatidylinositol 4-kinase